ncbi:MAG: inorganic diphosphatase [Deltaproteobacteria bacterium]|nr:inorganic diphosphatase [Deltaproteobacteria bacterium]
MSALARIGDSVRVRVEIPKGSLVKRRANGSVDFISPLPCPFDYGSLPDTRAADGDPIDALLVGEPQGRRRGTQVDARVLAIVRFIDAGAEDPKLVCGTPPLSPKDRRRVERFFRLYAPLKRALARLRRQRGETRYLGLDEG